MNMDEDKNMTGGPSRECLDEAVRRILSVVQPRRIILFGSASRGHMGPHSDLDFLVIMPDGIHRRRTSIDIFKALRGFELSKDVIVVTEKDVHQFGGNPSLVIKPAIDEGKVLYASRKNR